MSTSATEVETAELQLLGADTYLTKRAGDLIIQLGNITWRTLSPEEARKLLAWLKEQFPKADG